MGLIREVRERRLLAYVGAYLVTGFVALEGVDQLISHEILPAVAYPIALVFYVFGMLGSLTFAWYHGEKGRQETTRGEVIIHSTLFVLAIGASAYVFTSQRAAAEMAAAAASSGLEANRLAVLYFEDLSSGGELAHVADGLTEALIDQLSQVRSLAVISKNGVAAFRDADVTVDSIARTLEVGSLIRGSVEQTGNDLRVTARLVDGFSGADIERATIEMPAGAFLATRDSVAESVSRLLRQRLGEEVALRERQAGTNNVESWSLLQRAERLRKDAEDLDEAGDLDAALTSFQQADSLLAMAEAADPSWTEPPTLRARIASRRAFFIANETGDFDAAVLSINEGLEHVERALAIAANHPKALEQRGTLNYLLYLLDVTPDREEAERLLDRAQADLQAAVDGDPSLASAYSVLSHLYYQRQDNISVVLAARRAYEEDAFLQNADLIVQRLFWGHYDLEQFSDAGRWCDEGARRFSDNHNFVECQLRMMLTPIGEPDVESAWQLRDDLVSLAPDTQKPFVDRLGYLLVAGVLAKSGLTDSASSVFMLGRGDEEVDPQQDLVVTEAAIRATTGDPDGAMELLRRYVAANPLHSFAVGENVHWWWRDLRNRPDFQALTRRGN